MIQYLSKNDNYDYDLGLGMVNGVGEQKYAFCELCLLYAVTVINMAVILALWAAG